MTRWVAAVLCGVLGACGTNAVSVGGSGAGGGTGSAADGGSGQGGGAGNVYDAGPACTGLCAQVEVCAAGASTTVEGTVYDPAGKVPLYNVAVYIPNSTLDPVTEGSSCERCQGGQLSGHPITSTLTDSSGHFVLEGAPSGHGIPLVMQAGKWRRLVALPTVTGCTKNVVTDKQLTRLPRNRTEGHIPRMAIATGGADTLECLPRRMGLDDGEFGLPGTDARLHLYAGQPRSGGLYGQATDHFAATLNGGAALPATTALWSTVNGLKPYDVVLLSCEGDEYISDKPAAALAAMNAYGQQGGRVFATHWHEYFFRSGPAPWPQAGAWIDPTTSSYAQDDNNHVAEVNGAFPKGADFIKWLKAVGASAQGSSLTVAQVRYNLSSVSATYGQDWMRVRNYAPGETQPDAILYASFNTPLGAAEDAQCGRSVFSGLHVAAATLASEPADDAGQGKPFPTGCRLRDLTPQEKAMEFMLFDLTNCVQSDAKPPAIN